MKPVHLLRSSLYFSVQEREVSVLTSSEERASNQTCMFAGVHCSTVSSSNFWKRLVSSRLIEVGSGRSRAAAKEALATMMLVVLGVEAIMASG